MATTPQELLDEMSALTLSVGNQYGAEEEMVQSGANATYLERALREILEEADRAENIQDEWRTMGNSSLGVSEIREIVAKHLSEGIATLKEV